MKDGCVSDGERWLTLAAWQAEQADRLFAGAHEIRKVAANTVAHPCKPAKVTPFQFSFFDQLSRIAAVSEPELVDRARMQGIPTEAVGAYRKTRIVPRVYRAPELADECEDAP